MSMAPPRSAAGDVHTVSRTVPMLDLSRQNGPLRDEILAAIAQVCDASQFVFGPDCQAFEREMAAYCHTRHAVGCASGSDALLLALLALGIGPGDEVIVPSFTFFATASAVWRLGARPVMADVEPDTFNIAPAAVEQAITPATKAIIPVHLFGQCANMVALDQIARRHRLWVVEDAAQSIGAENDGRRAGSIGHLGCFSFYPTKNLGGFGDGGIITTNSDELAEKLHILRDHGQHPRYYHSLVGINSRLDSIQAAVLRIKLRQLDAWTAARTRHAQRYRALLARFDGAGLTLPQATAGGRHVWNNFTIRVPHGRRDALQRFLSEANVGTAIYYPVPLHRQACFSTLGYEEGSLPASERAAGEVLSLPVFAELAPEEIETVVAHIAAFLTTAA